MQIEWRISKVAELDSQGHSQPEIARILQVSIGTVNRDLSILRQQAKENIKRYIDERLPEEESGTKCNHKRSMEYSTKY
jgi:transposase